MQITYSDGAFRCRCTYEERLVLHEAGFRWDNDAKHWYTPDYGIASTLSHLLDEKAKRELRRVKILVKTWTKPVSIPEGESFLPFQLDSVGFALARNRSYLALDPGLGKTPIAAVITQTLFDQLGQMNVVYICPPFLTRNTETEFKRFAPRVPCGRYGEGHHKWLTIFPDSIISKPEVQSEIRKLAKRPGAKGTLLFVDEAHRFKNDDAARTKALLGGRGTLGIVRDFERVVFLSGTPMPNRPIELFSILSNAAPETIDFMNKFQYAQKYCAAFRNQWGWDFSGASNLDDLRKKVMGTFMLRKRKTELTLPEKLSEMVVLSDSLNMRMTDLSQAILKTLEPEDLMEGRIAAKLGKDELHLATYRKELGVLKAKPSAEFIDYILEEGDESVLVFAHHKEVISILFRELQHHRPIVITGETPMANRHELVKTFQSDPARRLFIGNIQAAGVGLTLTKATRVVFTEFSWVPAENDQASDRAHRYGQKSNVLVQYLVHEGSVDQAVIETVLRKKRITEKI